MDFIKAYDNHCVKITCKGVEGSGVLVISESEEYDYVITAKHCLEGTMEIPQVFTLEDIAISKIIDGTWESLNILDYKLHPNDDIAILLVNKTYGIEPLLFAEGKYRSQVIISGFPYALRNNESPKEYIHCEQSINRSSLELRTSRSMATFYQGEDTYIKGFSGSGIFIETQQGKLALVGIFTRLKEQQAAYNVLVGEPLDKVNNLLLDNDLPMLPNLLPEYMIRKVGSYSYLEGWKKDPRLNQVDWVELGSSRTLISEIQAHFLANDEINILHIVGRSGIGKTRTTLQACLENPHLKTVLYFSSYRNFESSFRDYIKNSHAAFKIVIDDISLQEWEQLNVEFAEYHERIRIITIGVVSENKLRSREGIRIINPPTDGDVISLIRHRDPSVDEEECKYFLRFCEKDLRLLMLLLSAYTKDTYRHSGPITMIASRFGSIESILTRIFQQFEGDIGDVTNFKYLFARLSLLVDIGVKGSHRDELQYLADYFGLNINDFDRVVSVAHKCWLGIIRTDFFEASPRALARLFFENEGWQLISNDLSNFVSRMPTVQMQKRFIDRAEECGEVTREEVEAALAAWFCQTFPEYDLSLISEVEKSKIFKVYTEFSPSTGLKWLRTAVVKASSEELSSFEGSTGFWGSNKSRRYIVWLCEHLACFQEYFWDCEEILFILAQHESENYISNNSQGVWKSFYAPILSNTETPFMERYQLLMDRLRNSTVDNVHLITDAVKLIFLNHYSRIVPPKVVGGRIVPEQWRPSSSQHLEELRKNAIQMIINMIPSLGITIKEKVIDFLIEEINTFIDYGFGNDLRYLFEQEQINDKQFRRLKYGLENYISRIQKYNWEDTHLKIATEWSSNLQANDLHSKIIEFTYRDYWEYFHAVGEEQVKRDVEQLAKDIIKNKFDLSQFTEIFQSEECNITSLMKLIERVAFFDVEENYKELVLYLICTNNLRAFVIAYFYGVISRVGSLPDWYTKTLDTYAERYPDSILDITITTDISKSGFSRILKLVTMTQNTANYLFKMQYSSWGEYLDDADKLSFLSQVKQIEDKTSLQVILRLVNMWNRSRSINGSTELFHLLFEVLRMCITETVIFDDWDWNETVKAIPNEYIEQKCELLALALVTWKPGHSQLDDYAQEQLMELAESYPAIVMDKIGQLMIDQKNNTSFFVNVYRGLFESINIEDVKLWVNNNGLNGALALARHIASPQPTEEVPDYIPPLTDWLLGQFGSNDRFFREFLIGRHSMEVYNVEEKVDNHKNLEEAMQPYLASNIRWVKEWAKYEIKNSKSIVDDHEKREAEIEREM